MKPTDRILIELCRAGRHATPPEESERHDPAFAARLAARWAAVATDPDPLWVWEGVLSRVVRGLAVLALLTGLTTWTGWNPVSAEPDAVLEAELLTLLPSP